VGYVALHLDSAYAETVHASQGRTVDHSLFLADGAVQAAAVYVALTRGRLSNHAYVPSKIEKSGRELLAKAIAEAPAARPAAGLALTLESSADVRELESSVRVRGL
jgi:ATP-dependent exoDNAse (exonuclease V) alpha subunit